MRRGFTLVELLVVISIISILSSIVFSNFQNVRMKARDSYRIQSLHELSKALELYKADTGHYPISGEVYSIYQNGNNWISDNNNFNWSNNYLQSQPHDPCERPGSSAEPPFSLTDGCASYGYSNGPDGSFYALIARLEDDNNSQTVFNLGIVDEEGRVFDGNEDPSDDIFVHLNTYIVSGE